MPGQVDSAMVMLSPGEIATREGVSKQAISKTVKRLIEEHHDLPVERDARGRIVRVSLAHLERHGIGRVEDASREAVTILAPLICENGGVGAADSKGHSDVDRYGQGAVTLRVRRSVWPAGFGMRKDDIVVALERDGQPRFAVDSIDTRGRICIIVHLSGLSHA